VHSRHTRQEKYTFRIQKSIDHLFTTSKVELFRFQFKGPLRVKMAQICPQSAATHPRKRRKLEDARLRDFFPVPESIGASDAKALENLPVYGSRKEPVFLGSEIAKTVGTDASGPKKMSASWNDERYAYKAS